MLYSLTGQSINHRPSSVCALVLGIVLFFLAMTSFAQVSEKPDETVYTIVEKQPEFPGGREALNEYLKVNTNYPSEAQKAKVSGRVFISFIVNIDGGLSDVQLVEGLGYGCDQEAIRVVKAMPRWLPGSQSGRLIRVKMKLPIAFGKGFPTHKGD